MRLLQNVAYLANCLGKATYFAFPSLIQASNNLLRIYSVL